MAEIKRVEIAQKGALGEDEHHFSNIFLAHPDPISIMRGADHRYTDVNPSFCSLFELTQSKIIGHTPQELNLWMAPDKFELLIGRIIAEGSAREVELQYQNATGRSGYFLASGQLLKLGSEECILLTGHDISGHKQYERSYEDQIDFLNQVINTMGEGLTVTDANRHFELVNPAFASLTGYSEEQLIGKQPLDVTFNEDVEAVNLARERRLQGDITKGEVRLVHLDNSLIPVLASSSPRLINGKYVGTISVYTDLREIKLAEKRHHESEDRFNKAFRSSPIGICLIRISDGRPVEANQAFLGMIGYSFEELLASNDKEDLTEIKRPRDWIQTVYQQGFIHDAEASIRTQSGHICHVLFSTELFEMETEPLIMLLCIDITSRKQAEAVLLAGRDELEQRVTERTAELQDANQEMETLIRTLAHDLRTPLRGIDGYSHILEESAAVRLDQDNQYAITRIKAGARRMGQLLDDLMDFLLLRRKSIHFDAINTNELMREVVNKLMSKTEKGRKITIKIGELSPCTADPILLETVFNHLLENAVKFTALRPETQIEVGMQDGAYFVRDNGVGFEQQYNEKIFGIFERLHRSEEFEGTGIGLAIVKRIINRHGGRIWAKSEIGKGATFYLTLG